MTTLLRRSSAIAAVAAAAAPIARKVGGFVKRWLRDEPQTANEARAFLHLNGFTEAIMNDVFHRSFQPVKLTVVK